MKDLLTHMNVLGTTKGQARALYDILRGRGDRGLNNREALSLFGIGSLSRRICDLQGLGVDIRKEPCDRVARATRYFYGPARAAQGA